MSPLTPDERPYAVEDLRESASLLGEVLASRLRALADKLEAEPEEARFTEYRETVQRKAQEFGERVAAAKRERDEAREALRELLAASVGLDNPRPDDEAFRQLVDARDAARAVLEGVERTHALVPVERSGDAARVMQRFLDMRGRSLPDEEHDRIGALVRAFAAVARGETPSWPGVASLPDESGHKDPS